MPGSSKAAGVDASTLNLSLPRPLEGVRVLDFSHVMAGPYASLILADFGADVVKVENPKGGDPSRGIGSHFVESESTVFLTWNRGKRSLAVDLKQEAGIEIIRRLAGRSDVLLENFRVGTLDRLGLGYEELAQVNEQLIYCSITGFGRSGPYAERPATDPIIQAMSGVMHATGERGGPPLLAGVPVADFTGALLAVQGILLGLFARTKTGRGDHVVVSLLDGLIFSLTTRLGPFLYAGEEPGRMGGAHSQIAPYGAFQTADGYLMTGVLQDTDWERWCDAVDCPEVADDPRFRTNRDRVGNFEELVATLTPIFRKRTTPDWHQRLNEAGVLVGPVSSFSEVFADPQVQQNGVLYSVDHPSLGDLLQVANPVRLKGFTTTSEAPPPLLGEHTDSVLAELGYSLDEVEELRATEVIRSPSRR